MSRRYALLPITATSEPSLLLSAKTIPKEILSASPMPNTFCMLSLHSLIEQTQDHTDTRLKKKPLDGPLLATEKNASGKIAELDPKATSYAIIQLSSWKIIYSAFGKKRQTESISDQLRTWRSSIPIAVEVSTISVKSKRSASAGFEDNAVLRETRDAHPRNFRGERIRLALAADIRSKQCQVSGGWRVVHPPSVFKSPSVGRGRRWGAYILTHETSS